MSSTNRGGKRSPADYYATPAWCVRRLLESDIPIKGAQRWLEPCAGNGAIIRAAKSDQWTAVELREEAKSKLLDLGIGVACPQDFFEWNPSEKFDVILTNPPFSLAMEFIRKSMTMATHSIFLLRLNFLGSEERSEAMRKLKPDLYVLPNRPAFTVNKDGKPSTDSIEYAWFHFHANASGRYVILPSTSAEERTRDNWEAIRATLKIEEGKIKMESKQESEKEYFDPRARELGQDVEGPVQESTDPKGE